MNARQELLTAIDPLPDEQLSAMLDLDLSLKSGKNLVHPMAASQAYQDWLSAENIDYGKQNLLALRVNVLNYNRSEYLLLRESQK